MEITATPQVRNSTAISGLAGSNQVTKDSFLQLLITQMRHQDPLSPMDNQQFLAQLAQFSALEQMQNMNDKLDASMLLSQSLNNSAATQLIGRTVRAMGSEVRLSGEGPVELGYFLPAEAKTVTVTIQDANGRVVRSLVAGGTTTGAHTLSWDGLDDAGTPAPEGTYTFRVAALDAAGASVSPSSIVSGVVDGVTYRNGNAWLLIAGREVSLSNVLEVLGATATHTEGGDR